MEGNAGNSDAHTCEEILAWLAAHNNVMPKEHKQPSEAQKAGNALKQRYRRLLQRAHHNTEVSQLLARIRGDAYSDVKPCRQVLSWLDAHGGAMPKEYSRPSEAQKAEYALALQYRKGASTVEARRRRW